jgi:ubiquinone/menaquinone biosynthesis C-methylase UbiE
MSDPRELQRHILGPILTLHMWSWSQNVFRPAQQLRRSGLYQPDRIGVPPARVRGPGRGPDLSRRCRIPVFLGAEPAHYDSVADFDVCSEEYEAAVKPYSQPIFEETVAMMEPYLAPDARVLDPSCGPGREAITLSMAVPAGEVVACDLSRGMVRRAHDNACNVRRTNMAFFQSDVTELPAVFDGYFDAVYCCLAFHHYRDGAAAMRAFHRVLGPGGKAFVADPGPAWYVALNRDLAKLADPGFVQHRTGAEFETLFREAGFASFYWEEALPGIGVMIACR